MLRIAVAVLLSMLVASPADAAKRKCVPRVKCQLDKNDAVECKVVKPCPTKRARIRHEVGRDHRDAMARLGRCCIWQPRLRMAGPEWAFAGKSKCDPVDQREKHPKKWRPGKSHVRGK